MIHDAKVEVTCDNPNFCRESVEVDLPYVYGGIMHTDGRYDFDKKAIHKTLEREHDWIVIFGKHFCSDSCAESAVPRADSVPSASTSDRASE